MQVRNEGGAPLVGIAIQFNKNFVGLTNAAPLQVRYFSLLIFVGLTNAASPSLGSRVPGLGFRV